MTIFFRFLYTPRRAILEKRYDAHPPSWLVVSASQQKRTQKLGDFLQTIKSLDFGSTSSRGCLISIIYHSLCTVCMCFPIHSMVFAMVSVQFVCTVCYTYDWFTLLDSHGSVCAVFFDLRNASISHQLLLGSYSILFWYSSSSLSLAS